MKQDEDLPLPKLPASADGRPWLLELEPKILKEHSVLVPTWSPRQTNSGPR